MAELAVALLLLLARPVAARNLQAAVAPVLARFPADACVEVADGTTALVAQQDTVPLAPASNMKLLTAAAALDVLGPDTRRSTRFAAAATTASCVTKTSVVPSRFNRANSSSNVAPVSASSSPVGSSASSSAGSFASVNQWLTSLEKANAEKTRKQATPTTKPAVAIASKTKKLSYKEQQEWDRMETSIALAEEALHQKQAAVESASTAGHVALTEACEAMEAAQQEVDRLYARWAELEEKRG